MTKFEWLGDETDETIVWDGRPRIQTIIPAVVAAVVIFAGSVAVAVVQDQLLFVSVGVLGLAAPIGAYLRVTNTRYVVTDDALYRKSGVFSRTVRRVSLDRIQNSTLSQSVTGSMFGYGTISAEAAGGGEIRFENVNDPHEARTVIDSRLDRDDIPGTVEQWSAVLEAVRALRSAVE
ncbi:PH domain-containing protein [Haloferax sp. S1W]|uniref:PH domain-containing protein n=1 Tax=Haloferax sp. S1W TaxID=3377110 RepID=UPI0037C7280D